MCGAMRMCGAGVCVCIIYHFDLYSFIIGMHHINFCIMLIHYVAPVCIRL